MSNFVLQTASNLLKFRIMASKVFSAAIVGFDSQIIEIEADISFGLRSFDIVGLPDKAVEESKERVRIAIKPVDSSHLSRKQKKS